MYRAESSATDSRVILGESGAEQLLGNGDMLFHRPGAPDARRIQGCFVDDGEVQRVAEALRRQGSPSYVSGVTEGAETADEDGESSVGGRGRKSGEKDPLKPCKLCLQKNVLLFLSCSVTLP